jgi:hypothetical protein
VIVRHVLCLPCTLALPRILRATRKILAIGAAKTLESPADSTPLRDRLALKSFDFHNAVAFAHVFERGKQRTA